MKTTVFSQYHPEWIDNFAQMREECAIESTKTKANSKKGVRKSGKKKSKRIVEALAKLKEAYENNQMQEKHAQAHQTENFMNCRVPVTVSADYVNIIHAYARPPGSGGSLNFKFKCSECKVYQTDKKSNYDEHVKGCNKEPEKNLSCPICENMFSYRTLRQHLGHYATGKHQTSNKHHTKYNPSDHKSLLNSLKALKKQNK